MENIRITAIKPLEINLTLGRDQEKAGAAALPKPKPRQEEPSGIKFTCINSPPAAWARTAGFGGAPSKFPKNLEKPDLPKASVITPVFGVLNQGPSSFSRKPLIAA